MSDKKWKFFFNGVSWWLKITDPLQLAEYLSRTDEDRFGGAMMNVANEHVYGGSYDNPIAKALDVTFMNSGVDLLTTTAMFRNTCHLTYFKNLQQFGFVNINKNGGCNSMDWPEYAVVKQDNLIFPCLTKKDVTLKTWQMTEREYGQFRDTYNYHWYAYLGNVRLTDGNTEKWNSKAEAEAFVDRLFANA